MPEKKKERAWLAWLRQGVLILLVAMALCLWWMEGRTPEKDAAAPTATPVPTAARDERSQRETAYDRDVAALQALLESGAADEATQEMAAQKLAALIAEHQSEIALEAALVEAGYASAVVMVQNGAVTVMIPSDRLDEAASAQILSLCVAHAQVGAENVRIMERNE